MIDRTGQRFGNWLAIRRAGPQKCQIFWLCQCKCGRKQRVRASNLVSGMSTQCMRCAVQARTGVPQPRPGRTFPAGYKMWQRAKLQGTCVARWHRWDRFLSDMGPPPQGARLRRRTRGRLHGPHNSYWEPPINTLPAALQVRLDDDQTRDEAIREAITVHNISQTAIGKRMRLSRQRIWQILGGRR